MKSVSVKKIDPIINCGPLVSISLSENEIRALDAGVFIECSSLEILDLSMNQIRRIDENAFSSLNALIELDLSENNLERLTRKTIKPMKSLKKLSLRNNKLRILQENLFNDLAISLTDLDLSHNPLKRLDFRIFDFTVAIESLKLTNVEIIKFHKFTFKNLRRLRSLDISENILTNIDDEMLANNKELTELKMNSCNIKAVGRHFFDSLDKLTLAEATGNKCVDGISSAPSVVSIRPMFLMCMQNWDSMKETSRQQSHSGEEL